MTQCVTRQARVSQILWRIRRQICLAACLMIGMGLAALSVSPAMAHETLPASGTIEVAFTPWDDAEGALLNAVRQARQTIHVQAYLFTSKTIARALIEAHQRGIKVEVLADYESQLIGKNGQSRSQIPQLVAAGIPVWIETRYAAAHNKIILLDANSATATVMTGSYNFTYSAQARNAENLLILRDNPALARAYLANWQRHRSEAQNYAASLSEPKQNAQTPYKKY